MADEELSSLLSEVTLSASPAASDLTFTPFPRLPRELRNKIWKFAAHEPRDVEVLGPNEPHTWYDFTLGDIGAGNTTPPKRFRSLTAVPAMLHTCQEAREEGLRYYCTWFKLGNRLYKIDYREAGHTVERRCWVAGAEDRSIYVNIEVDTLFIRAPFSRLGWWKDLRRSVRSQPTCVPSWSPPPCQLAIASVEEFQWRRGNRPCNHFPGEIICIIKKVFKADKGEEAKDEEERQLAESLGRMKAKTSRFKYSIWATPNRRKFASDVVLWDEIWTGLFEWATRSCFSDQ